MGNSPHIDATRYPKQGEYLNQQVRVIFHYDSTQPLCGICIRDDVEGDGVTVIRLSDGRAVLGSECQYSLR